MNPRALFRSLGAIGAALLCASLLGFVLLGLVARWLTPDDNARFQVLWGAVMAFGSVLSVIEQEVSRQAARASASERRLPASILQLFVVGGILSLGAFGVLLAVPSGRAIFMDSLLVVAISFVAIGGFVVQYTVRGVLIGVDDRWRYAGVILLEAVARTALAAWVYVGHVRPSFWLAACIIAVGSLGWIPVARSAFARVDRAVGKEAWTTVVHKVSVLGGANGLSACVLTGFPTVVAMVLGSTMGMGSFFLAVTLTRIPLVLLAPVQAMAVPVATRLVLRGDRRGLSRLQGTILVGVVSVAAAGALVTAWIGPFFYRLFFGAQYSISGGMLALLVAATVVIAGALLQAAMLIALERYGHVLITWACAAASVIVCLLVAHGDPIPRTATAFTVCSLVACTYAAVALQRAVRKVQNMDGDLASPLVSPS